MDRIQQLFKQKQHRLLSVYFTAGHPSIDQLTEIIISLDEAGADMIEIGMPFSDPVADGLTIQQSNKTALKNGMSIALLLQLLKPIRQYSQVPLILMGYLNPLLKYGFEKFCNDAKDCGIDALIIPDLPLSEYHKTYHQILSRYGLKCIFLITPQTPEERVRLIDALSTGFIYMVTSSSVTGNEKGFKEEQLHYMSRIKNMRLNNPVLAGFGISCKEDFDLVSQYVNGGIIGSRFIKTLESSEKDIKAGIYQFISAIRPS